MFPLIPALILLLLHGPSNFERLAQSGRLPSALAAFRYEVSRDASHAEVRKEDASRRVLATFIAASGDRALSEAFASMFVSSDCRLSFAKAAVRKTSVVSEKIDGGSLGALRDGFFRCVRSRDGPWTA
jgi:hypothetical protein